ncbi:type VI secretion system ImpA family N-terminal domain-containing protein [Salmonella enterica subsp. enterica serovar Saintpaul]|nr:type VI secretion system ImpA family N-terminal domain-containing protein [Salmonella enterica subsp. enterica serovar Saintpaul]
MNDIHSRKINTGGDPRPLADYAALRDELAKLSHPARPDVDWGRVEQLSLSLFRQNGVELQTLCWYTLARTRITGLAGLNEGLAILEALLTHQWGTFWPQPVHARMEILTGFSQRLQAVLRTLNLNYGDLPQVYKAEEYLNAIRERLQRLALKNASQIGELCAFMHNAVIRLENIDASNSMPVTVPLSASSVGLTEPLVYIVHEAPVVPQVVTESGESTRSRPWRSFAGGALTMLVLGSTGLWGWQKLTPPPGSPLPVVANEASLEALSQFSPLWLQNYGFVLAASAAPSDAEKLKAQWQRYIRSHAISDSSLAGWHAGMDGLQALTQRLNALDERKGKYLTGSELKSMVFTITQDFSRATPVEAQLFLLSQFPSGMPLPEAQILQTDMHLSQLINRYMLIKQRAETSTP